MFFFLPAFASEAQAGIEGRQGGWKGGGGEEERDPELRWNENQYCSALQNEIKPPTSETISLVSQLHPSLASTITFRPGNITSESQGTQSPAQASNLLWSLLSFLLRTMNLWNTFSQTNCNRNPETRQKLCGAVRWYRAAVVWRLWRRRLIPETRVRFPVATHLLTSLNLPVSSLAPDSNWIPVTPTSTLAVRRRIRSYRKHGTRTQMLENLSSWKVMP